MKDMHCKNMKRRQGNDIDQKLHGKHVNFKKWLLRYGHIKTVDDKNAVISKYFDFSGNKIILNNNMYDAVDHGYMIPQCGKAQKLYQNLKEFLLNFHC